jgi:hypothetical protein
MAKAMQESANVARRLGESEATDKNLGILDRMRPIIGEEAYMERVKLLFPSIPLPTSFGKDCKVICIDGGSEQEEDDDKSVSEDDTSNDRISTSTYPHRTLMNDNHHDMARRTNKVWALPYYTFLLPRATVEGEATQIRFAWSGT